MTALDLEFSRLINQFPAEIYQHTVEGVDGNVVFSPISILIALSFAMFGASGKTANEMKSALNFNEISEEKLLESFQKLSRSFGTGGVSVANKIYLMKNYSVKQKFKEIAIQNFQSEAETVNFARNVETSKTINQWVESKTNNKIKDLINEDDLNGDTRLVLVNAIYFKADWVNAFNAARNFKDQFHLNEKDSVEVEYMSQRESFAYGKFDELDATALQLPYKNSKVSMLIILPNTKSGLSAVQSKLDEINFNDIAKKLSEQHMQVIIPKFMIEFEIDLEGPLKKMGMQRMFSNDAEFENMLTSPEHLKVSKVIHKAFIEIDEKGTEAGAATAILMRGDSAYEMPTFMADRPFLFALIEDSKVLFVGRKVK